MRVQPHEMTSAIKFEPPRAFVGPAHVGAMRTPPAACARRVGRQRENKRAASSTQRHRLEVSLDADSVGCARAKVAKRVPRSIVVVNEEGGEGGECILC